MRVELVGSDDEVEEVVLDLSKEKRKDRKRREQLAANAGAATDSVQAAMLYRTDEEYKEMEAAMRAAARSPSRGQAASPGPDAAPTPPPTKGTSPQQQKQRGGPASPTSAAQAGGKSGDAKLRSSPSAAQHRQGLTRDAARRYVGSMGKTTGPSRRQAAPAAARQSSARPAAGAKPAASVTPRTVAPVPVRSSPSTKAAAAGLQRLQKREAERNRSRTGAGHPLSSSSGDLSFGPLQPGDGHPSSPQHQQQPQQPQQPQPQRAAAAVDAQRGGYASEREKQEEAARSYREKIRLELESERLAQQLQDEEDEAEYQRQLLERQERRRAHLQRLPSWGARSRSSPALETHTEEPSRPAQSGPIDGVAAFSSVVDTASDHTKRRSQAVEANDQEEMAAAGGYTYSDSSRENTPRGGGRLDSLARPKWGGSVPLGAGRGVGRPGAAAGARRKDAARPHRVHTGGDKYADDQPHTAEGSVPNPVGDKSRSGGASHAQGRDDAYGAKKRGGTWDEATAARFSSFLQSYLEEQAAAEGSLPASPGGSVDGSVPRSVDELGSVRHLPRAWSRDAAGPGAGAGGRPGSVGDEGEDVHGDDVPPPLPPLPAEVDGTDAGNNLSKKKTKSESVGGGGQQQRKASLGRGEVAGGAAPTTPAAATATPSSKGAATASSVGSRPPASEAARETESMLLRHYSAHQRSSSSAAVTLTVRDDQQGGASSSSSSAPTPVHADSRDRLRTDDEKEPAAPSPTACCVVL